MSSLLTAEVIDALQPVSGRTLLVAVGNSLRSDDGVGPYIASCLTSNEKIAVIDAGFSPENVMDKAIAIAPEKIIVMDAADFGAAAADVRVIPEDIIPQTTLSTHMIPLNVIMSVIRESVKTSVVFIGIQVKSAVLGEGLCPEVKAAADEIVRVIKDNFGL